MQAFEDIEKQLWEYLDNTCSEADRARIAHLVQADSTWKKLHDELYVLHKAISTVEPDQPSLRFTKNVIDATANMRIAPRIEKYLNRNIIRAIAAFFILSLGTMLVYALANVNWTAATGTSTPSPKVNTDFISSPLVMQVSMYVGTLTLLVFIDSLLKKRRQQKHSSL